MKTIRFMFVCGLVVICTGIVELGQAPLLDEYAIYSKMISSPDEVYLIEELTSTNRGGTTLSPPCVSELTTADSASFTEVLADYDRRKDTTTVLEKKFNLNRPYQLLAAAVAREFLNDALRATPQIAPVGVPMPVNSNPLYVKSKHVFRLGGVFFNLSHTRAIAYAADYETPYDGHGGWQAFRKTDAGQWEKYPTWRTCGWGSAR